MIADTMRMTGRIAVAFLLSTAATQGATVVDELCSILMQRGVVVDTNLVEHMALEGALRAVDPGGRLVRAGQTGFLDGESVARGECWGEGLCYLKLQGIYSGAGAQVEEILSRWSEQGHFGLLLDLRGASGFSLESVERLVTALGGDEGMTYGIRDGQGNVTAWRHATGTARPWAGKPIMVLVDGETRDASELLAGLLRRMPNVMLIGSATKGDAGVRELIPLSNGALAHVATGWITFADGQGWTTSGVQPHVTVETNARGMTVRRPAGGDPGRRRPFGAAVTPREEAERRIDERVGEDPVLRRAADVLLGFRALDLRSSETASGAESGSNVE